MDPRESQGSLPDKHQAQASQHRAREVEAIRFNLTPAGFVKRPVSFAEGTPFLVVSKDKQKENHTQMSQLSKFAHSGLAARPSPRESNVANAATRSQPAPVRHSADRRAMLHAMIDVVCTNLGCRTCWVMFHRNNIIGVSQQAHAVPCMLCALAEVRATCIVSHRHHAISLCPSHMLEGSCFLLQNCAFPDDPRSCYQFVAAPCSLFL